MQLIFGIFHICTLIYMVVWPSQMRNRISLKDYFILIISWFKTQSPNHITLMAHFFLNNVLQKSALGSPGCLSKAFLKSCHGETGVRGKKFKHKQMIFTPPLIKSFCFVITGKQVYLGCATQPESKLELFVVAWYSVSILQTANVAWS